MTSSVPTHLINNAFTHKLHFPPLVILPLVPAAKQTHQRIYFFKTSTGTLTFKLGLFEKHVLARLTQVDTLVLSRLAFDTRFPAFNDPCSRADFEGAGRVAEGNFLEREKFFSPLSCS